MGFTTIAALTTALNSLAVSGVSRSYSTPPNQVNTADLPAKFIGFPESETPIISFTSVGGLRQVSIQVIVLISPVQHNTNRVNYPLAVQVMDSLHDVFATNAADLGIDRWTMTLDTDQVGDAVYWAIVSTIFLSG